MPPDESVAVALANLASLEGRLDRMEADANDAERKIEQTQADHFALRDRVTSLETWKRDRDAFSLDRDVTAIGTRLTALEAWKKAEDTATDEGATTKQLIVVVVLGVASLVVSIVALMHR